MLLINVYIIKHKILIFFFTDLPRSKKNFRKDGKRRLDGKMKIKLYKIIFPTK